MEKRTWTAEEKLKIIAEAKIEVVKVTLDKYGIYPATCYSSWFGPLLFGQNYKKLEKKVHCL